MNKEKNSNCKQKNMVGSVVFEEYVVYDIKAASYSLKIVILETGK